jgi:hypothetical protein
MGLNVGDQEYNGGKKYRQKGTLCGPNSGKDKHENEAYLHSISVLCWCYLLNSMS